MASCVSCGKNPIRKSKSTGAFECPRCGPRPFKIEGRLVMPAHMPQQEAR